MATMRHLPTQAEARFWRRITVGRDPACELPLSSLGVSNKHATIQWTGSQWVIRDLGSRNGTKVNHKLLLSTSFPLAPGDEIVFGDPQERWAWVDGASPTASALSADGVIVDARAGMLLLPSENTPRATIFARDDAWQLEMGGDVRAVRDGEWIDVEGARFCLRLPAANPAADHTQTIIPQSSIVDAGISFFVSQDEEFVRITLESDGRRFELASRAFHYMLLLLGRQRHEDAANGISPAEAGWIYADDLAKQLGVDQTNLNTNVCRARQAAASPSEERSGSRRARGNGGGAEARFKDAHELVQRRNGQIRLGLAKIDFSREERPTTGSPTP